MRREKRHRREAESPRLRLSPPPRWLHHPGGRPRAKVAQVLLLPPAPLRLTAPPAGHSGNYTPQHTPVDSSNGKIPGETHHHGNNDGDLHGSDDGGDEDVVKLLAAGNHVENIKVQQLVTLGAPVGGLTPGNTHSFRFTSHEQDQQETPPPPPPHGRNGPPGFCFWTGPNGQVGYQHP